MKKGEVLSLLIRYGLLVVLAGGDLWVFYKVFTPLTIYPVTFILDKLYGAYLIEGTVKIVFQGIVIEIVRACVAGSAYYLLLMLNLTTPMKKIVHLKSILFLFSAFFIANIVRIVIFAILFSNGYGYFDLAHRFTWYVLSTLLVIGVWFASVLIFRIEDVPGYSDMRKIIKEMKNKRIRKR